MGDVKKKLLTSRIRGVELADGTKVNAPWQFRNCAMGGRHTEKEYPESNVSVQESMFMPPSSANHADALRGMKFDELRARFGEAAAAAIEEGKDVHVLLREQLPVYAVPAEATA